MPDGGRAIPGGYGIALGELASPGDGGQAQYGEALPAVRAASLLFRSLG